MNEWKRERAAFHERQRVEGVGEEERQGGGGRRKMLSLQRTGKGRQGDFPSRLPCGGVNWGKEQQKVGFWEDRSVEKAERRELTHIGAMTHHYLHFKCRYRDSRAVARYVM